MPNVGEERVVSTGEVDDSLYLGWEDGKPQTADKKYLSVSAGKQIVEDPQKYYLQRIAKIKEPQSLPLLLGSAGHEALEEFFAAPEADNVVEASIERYREYVDQNFGQVLAPTIRINPDDPKNPRDKEEIELSKEEVMQRGEYVLKPLFRIMQEGVDWFTPFRQMQKGGSVEHTLGSVAKRRGRPYTEVPVFNWKTKRREVSPVALIGGVPFHGFIDLICEWEDGSEFIIDHKLVSKVVSFYPPYSGNGPWTSYDPSYNVADSKQLDIYSYGTGIVRSGFQFLTKNPQYTRPDNTVHDDWVDEEDWLKASNPEGKYPMAWAQFKEHPPEDLHYLMVWRPAPGDHPNPSIGTQMHEVMPRAVSFARQAAEYLTESLILLEKGAAPHVAFPAGNPKDISKKACPFCFYNERGDCPRPRDRKNAQSEYQQDLASREKWCLRIPEIVERRALWRS